MSRRIVQPPLDQWVTTGVENTVFAAVEGLALAEPPPPSRHDGGARDSRGLPARGRGDC